jgi:hypothetical protein
MYQTVLFRVLGFGFRVCLNSTPTRRTSGMPPCCLCMPARAANRTRRLGVKCCRLPRRITWAKLHHYLTYPSIMRNRNIWVLFGTCSCWFLLDIAFYSQVVSPCLLKLLICLPPVKDCQAAIAVRGRCLLGCAAAHLHANPKTAHLQCQGESPFVLLWSCQPDHHLQAAALLAAVLSASMINAGNNQLDIPGPIRRAG